MRERTEGKSARLGLITAAAAVIAVLALLLSGLGALPSGAPSGGGAAYASAQVAVHPAATPATQLYINRSQGSGTYVPEYVSLNNTTTLSRLPLALLTANGCRWVTVENVTAAAAPASVFHNVQYSNVTAANASGSVVAHAWVHAFKICAGTAVWVNYQYWTYSIYQFSSVGLGVSANVTVYGISDWSGTSIAPPNETAKIGPKAEAAFVIPSNLSAFSVLLPSQVVSAATCDVTGQLCSYSRYTLSSSTDTANVTTSDVLKFTAASGLKVTAAYENWSVGYTNSTVSANTEIGAFFSLADSGFQAVFVAFWYLWVLVLLVIIVIALYGRGRRGSRGRR